jgi:DNA repair protein RecN (Recombination protein N)
LERAAREEEWLRHAVDELAKLAAAVGEEAALAQARTGLQAAERRAEAIAAAMSEITPRDRRAMNPAAALRAAARALGKLVTETDQTAVPALAALEAAEDSVMQAEQAITRLAEMAEPNPRLLEATEERLFALRAAARKYQIAVTELPGLLEELRTRLAALDQGVAGLARLEAEEAAAAKRYRAAAGALTQARVGAAGELEAAVMAELPPLRLEKAKFIVEVGALPVERAGPLGLDLVRFLIAANPGQPAGPLDRVASGGELSRLMLALKVVLARASPVPSLVFDEVDSGIGGATASAVGERIARVAERLQVMLVTHSPQVAARGAAHLRVSKRVVGERTETLVQVLTDGERREEIARMLAGEVITDAARLAADVLLGA